MSTTATNAASSSTPNNNVAVTTNRTRSSRNRATEKTQEPKLEESLMSFA